MAEDKTVVVHKRPYQIHAALVAEHVGEVNFITPSAHIYDVLDTYDDACIIHVITLTAEDTDTVIKAMGVNEVRGSLVALDIHEKLLWLLRVPLLGKWYLTEKHSEADIYAFFGN